MKILTFDIEDWFHILDNQSTKNVSDWERYPSRLASNMSRILDLLDKYKQKATFFCLGWIAERYPEEIRRISERGHEIGSHSHNHQLVYELSAEVFEADLVQSKETLEQLIGKSVRAYRAPGFSITSKSRWAFDILAKHGIEVDCSIFPARRSHGGFSSFGTAKPCLLDVGGQLIREFPINSFPFFTRRIIYSGGGYFRLFPLNILRSRLTQDDYVMTYFHPRDFDPDQPMIPELSITRKFKSYVGLSRSFSKLEQLIGEFKFISLGDAEQIVCWDQVETIKINSYE